ncbi:MAG: hypothetical protein U1E89_15610 [Burkholderiaceae bacterium]
MKSQLVRTAAVATVLLASATAWATDVGVSVQVSQPGVYGRIDIGRFPQPAVIVPQPVIVQAPPPPPMVVAQPRPVLVQPQPVYMWVPPGHRRDWRRHCHEYGACGVPVYFVRHDWYQNNVMVARDGRRVDERDRGHDRGRGHGKGRGRHDD